MPRPWWASGTWGNQPQFWPTRHGFESFFGVIHSNDMPDFALYDNERKVEQPVQQASLTRRYTEAAQSFIQGNAGQPFFLYLSHTFPHVPLFASERFRGQSAAAAVR